MTPRDGYASVTERIQWTDGFQLPSDKVVLHALATFANFKTGTGAHPNIRTLAQRAHLSEATVYRALDRLEADGWIVGRRRHRHATTWTIVIDRLVATWGGAKVVVQPNRDLKVDPVENFDSHGESQIGFDSHGESQTGSFDSHGESPIPCTYVRSPVQEIPSPDQNLPTPSAPGFPQAKTPTDEGRKSEPSQPTLLGPILVSPERPEPPITDVARLRQIFREALAPKKQTG